MSSYTFAASPSRSFYIMGTEQTVNLDQAISDQLLASGGIATRDVALSILRKISLESNIAAFFSHPYVAIPLIVIASTLVIVVTITALIALSVAIGGALSGLVKLFSITLGIIAGLLNAWAISCHDEWNELSEAYSEQSLRAQEYVEVLQDEDADVRFLFPLPRSADSHTLDSSDSDAEPSD